MLARIALVLALLLAAGASGLYAVGMGAFGRHEAPGDVTHRAVPRSLVAAREAAQARAAVAIDAPQETQILFGDLHVHTTFSLDAYLISLPFLGGEGAHPPADACDYARFCSALDFWSINDHAEALTAENWAETLDTVRQCNSVAGHDSDPDLVTFLGWEWTQVGATPDAHYGHKNVVLAHTDDARIPARPIASRGLADSALAGPPWPARALLAAQGGDRRYHDFARYVREREERVACPDGVPVRQLPPDCLESAATPGELFEKLDDWGHDAIVIPHGTTWGLYTPAGSSWDKQLTSEQHDPARQTLLEVFSGHGNGEEYRGWRAARFDARGAPVCPEPTPDYLPSCWRAGELIRGRCEAAGQDAAECERRAVEARALYLAGGNAGRHVVPGESVASWLDAGQCRDCFLPAFNYRPGGSAQYLLALTNFEDPEAPQRFRFGFMASSDNHTARPGTGYKERDRRELTEASGPVAERWAGVIGTPQTAPLPRSRPFDATTSGYTGFQLTEIERGASFFLTGGLIAAHATGRSRGEIWSAFERREVYGTSGDRILLWFDLVNAPGAAGGASLERTLPMGSAVAMQHAPRMRVRAVGAFRQKPGCPPDSANALGPQRLHHLCRGECYHPSDERKRITRIEVVRIRPQAEPNEPIDGLIEDPWRSFECPQDADGCTVTFEDPEFAAGGRDAVYYARAIEEPSETVNAGNLRCERDAAGECIEPHPCYGDYRTDYQDDCTAPSEERAWSSPLYVDHGP